MIIDDSKEQIKASKHDLKIIQILSKKGPTSGPLLFNLYV